MRQSAEFIPGLSDKPVPLHTPNGLEHFKLCLLICHTGGNLGMSGLRGIQDYKSHVKC